MARSFEPYSRPKGRRRKAHELSKCMDCSCDLTADNWPIGLQNARRYFCQPCWRSRQNNYNYNDPEKFRIKNEKERIARANWDEKRKETERLRTYQNQLRKNYGLSLADYDNMLDQQQFKCAICKTDEPDGKGRFHVDHFHTYGHVRQLLCSRCNMMLGMAYDDIEILRSAITYLERHRPQMKYNSPMARLIKSIIRAH